MVKVGIPRALLYYTYFPAWQKFFATLGVQVVLSEPTSKKTIDAGIKAAVDETCLPVKVFLGHLVDLKEKGVDYIFCPRVISVEPKRYLCPKFLGLPNMAVHLVKGLPPLLDMEVNLHKKADDLPRQLYKLARRFTLNPFRIKNSIAAAWKEEQEYAKKLRQGFTPHDLLDHPTPAEKKQSKLKIAVLGHIYNLNDPFLSMNLFDRLRDKGVDVLTAEMLTEEDVLQGVKKLEKDIFWTFGKEILGAANYFLEQKTVDGVIVVVSFGCGPDSLIVDLIERSYKRSGTIPLMKITLDEHTGDAGVLTRLEAFLDLVQWREVKCR
jgi:predicted nucleotide-binding protein (sugar kinase/HSP70/actin superfamily)